MPALRATAIALLSYALASLVAATLVLTLLGSNPAKIVQYLPGASLLVLLFALVPFGIALAILRAVHRTGFWAHVLAGLLVSLVAQFLMSPGLLVRPAAVLDNWPVPVAGLAAGACYWLVWRQLTGRFERSR